MTKILEAYRNSFSKSVHDAHEFLFNVTKDRMQDSDSVVLTEDEMMHLNLLADRESISLKRLVALSVYLECLNLFKDANGKDALTTLINFISNHDQNIKEVASQIRINIIKE